MQVSSIFRQLKKMTAAADGEGNNQDIGKITKTLLESNHNHY